MSVVRSPNYPQMDLADALEAIREAYKQEHRNKMSRSVLAAHLGYTSLNGRALAKIGAVRAYGLISGLQDDLRVSADAITCLEAPEDDPERAAALARCALKPPIFREIHVEFPTLPSEQNLRFFLVKRNYTSDAAGKAAQTYLSTMRLVAESGAAYPNPEAAATPTANVVEGSGLAQSRASATGVGAQASPPRVVEQGMRQSIFPLDEGDVTLTFPANLSSYGYAELKEYLDIFLRRAERSKRLQEAQDDFSDIA